MRWPWQHRKEEPVRSTAIAVAADTAPSEDLVRAREALNAAQQALSRARQQRPRVEAVKSAAEQTISRNHLAELVRGALGSGT